MPINKDDPRRETFLWRGQISSRVKDEPGLIQLRKVGQHQRGTAPAVLVSNHPSSKPSDFRGKRHDESHLPKIHASRLTSKKPLRHLRKGESHQAVEGAALKVRGR